MESPNLELSEDLRHAAYIGDLARVQRTLKKGVNPNFREDGHDAGATALYWASKHGHMQIVKLLLSIPGIDKNAVRENDNETPIMAAAGENHWKIVDLLFDNGADPSIATFGPLHYRHTLQDLLGDTLTNGYPPDYVVRLDQKLRATQASDMQPKVIGNEPPPLYGAE